MKITSVAIRIVEGPLEGLVFSLDAPNRHNHIFNLLSWGNSNDRMGKEEQGFLLENGDFVDRKQAGDIALENGQVTKLIAPPNLYSEDLW